MYIKVAFLVSQMLQVAEYHARTAVPFKSLKRPSIKVRRQKLLTFLQGISFLDFFIFYSS